MSRADSLSPGWEYRTTTRVRCNDLPTIRSVVRYIRNMWHHLLTFRSSAQISWPHLISSMRPRCAANTPHSRLTTARAFYLWFCLLSARVRADRALEIRASGARNRNQGACTDRTEHNVLRKESLHLIRHLKAIQVIILAINSYYMQEKENAKRAGALEHKQRKRTHSSRPKHQGMAIN